MRRGAWIALVVLVGCADTPRPRTELEGDAGIGVPDAAIVDAGRGPDAGVDAALADARVPCCALAVQRLPTEGFEAEEPFVSEGVVYVHRRGPEGTLRAVRADTGAPVAGPADQLVDIRAGMALLQRPDGVGGWRLVVRYQGQDHPVAEARGRWPSPFGRSQQPVVDRALAAWIGAEGVAAWTPEGGQVALAAGPARDVVAAGTRVAWVADGRLWLADLGRRDAPVTDVAEISDDGWPVLTPEGLFWLHRGAVFGRLLDGTPTPDIAPWNTVCDDLVAHGRTVVARCGGADGRHLVLRYLWGRDDPAELLTDAPYVAGIAAGSAGVAWAEYDSPDAWCGGQAPGALWWARAECAEPERVGEVGAGCLCCGAFWPMLRLRLEGDVLASNYGGVRDGPQVAVARCAP